MNHKKYFISLIVLVALAFAFSFGAPLLHTHPDSSVQHDDCAVCLFGVTCASGDIEQPAVIAGVFLLLYCIWVVIVAVPFRPYTVLLSLSPPHLIS